MKLQWTKQAGQQFADAIEYIAMDNAEAADRLEKKINQVLKGLLQFPEMGRVGRIPGTRELPVAGSPYIAVYLVRPLAIRILALIHGAQRWPSSFKH